MADVYEVYDEAGNEYEVEWDDEPTATEIVVDEDGDEFEVELYFGWAVPAG